MLAFIFTIAIKPMLLLSLIYAMYRNTKLYSANFRYFIVTLGFALLPLLLFFDVVGQALTVSFPFDNHNSFWLSSRAELLVGPWQWLIAFSVFITIWQLLYLTLGNIVLAVRTKNLNKASPSVEQRSAELSRQLDIAVPVQVYIDQSSNLPCTWGMRKPVISLPAQSERWTAPILDMVLLHELAHIKNNDFFRKTLSRVIVALFWYLPPVWWLLRTSEELAERAADDVVLNSGIPDAQYAELLLQSGKNKVVQDQLGLSITGTAQSDYFIRVLSVMDRYLDRDTYLSSDSRQLFLLILLSTITLGVVDFTLVSTKENVGFSLSFILQEDRNVTAGIDKDAGSPDLVDKTTGHNRLDKTQRDYSLWPHEPSRNQFDEEIIVIAKPMTDIGEMKAEIENPVLEPAVSISGYLPLSISTPNYPRRALARQLESSVVVEFTVGIDGFAKNIKIVSADHIQYFKATVLESMKKNRYRPQLIGDAPIEVSEVREVFSFKIKN